METKNINDLKPDPKNPRRLSEHDGKSLQNSMDKFGDLGCIVFNIRTEQLVGGHQRLEIMKRLGGEHKLTITNRYDQVDEVGTVAIGYIWIGNKQFAYREVDWDEGTQRAANIAANRVQGEFDLDLLAQVNYEISLLDNGQDLLGLTGQTEQEVSNLLDMVAGNDNPEEDEAPAVDEVNPPVSKLGEIYQLGKHRLMCGDSTDFGQVSDLMDGKTADMVFTDPPYGVDVVQGGKVGADFGVAAKGQYSNVINDDTTETAQKSWELIKSLNIKKSIIWGGNYFVDFLPMSDGWLIWDKRGDSGIRNTFADGEMAWCSFHTPVRIYKQLWNGMIREGEKDKRVHPTQKPINMLGEVIKDFSERGQLVLDLFGGSGSTLIACDKLDRTCYMMELDPKYVDVIRKRYWKVANGESTGWQEGTPAII